MWKVYAIKTLYRTKISGKAIKIDNSYIDLYDMIEERITTLKARTFDEAIRKGEKEAKNYINDSHINPYGQKVITEYIGSIDVYEPFDNFSSNIEVFSSTHLVEKNISNEELTNNIFGKVFNNEQKMRKIFLNREFSGSV